MDFKGKAHGFSASEPSHRKEAEGARGDYYSARDGADAVGGGSFVSRIGGSVGSGTGGVGGEGVGGKEAVGKFATGKSDTKKGGASGGGFFSGIGEAIRRDREGKGSGIRLARDLGYALLGFLFGGCHLLFGAYPLGIALVAVLPRGMFIAAVGVILGSLTLGKGGVIYALVAVLTLLLRLIISGGEHKSDTPTAASDKSGGKGVALETGSAAGASFAEGTAGADYKASPGYDGTSGASVGEGHSSGTGDRDSISHTGRDSSGSFFGLAEQSLLVRISCGVIGGFVTAIYEILLRAISLETVLFGLTMILSPALLIFLFSGFFDKGITLSQLLFGGKELVFRPLSRARGAQAVSSEIFLRVSALLLIFFVSLSLKRYSLFGVDSALIFASALTLFAAKRFGAVYGGVCGFVSSFGISSLYSLSFVLAGVGAGALFPFGTAYALVAGGALLCGWGAYSGGMAGTLTVLAEYSISAVAMLPLFRCFEREAGDTGEGDGARQALDMVGTMALAYRNRMRDSSCALEERLSRLAPVVKEFLADDRKEAAALSGEHPYARCSPEEYYELFARLMEDARRCDEENRDMDEALTEALERLFFDCGFKEGVIRAFGKRRKYIICAGEDRSGQLITSKALLQGLSDTAGLRLASPDYFRRGDMVLMECSAAPAFRLETVFHSVAGEGGEVSGDSCCAFEGDDMSYVLISDGMGSGTRARETSRFACDFLSGILGTGVGVTPCLHGLNAIVRERRVECSATVDLFCFDSLNGSASFVKSGASPSFIKRGSSIFRIKSETMPLGLLKRVDAESISAELSDGDIVIMMSDGVADNSEDCPWLLELLGSMPSGDLKSFVRDLTRSAARHHRRPDDMTVAVARVRRIE